MAAMPQRPHEERRLQPREGGKAQTEPMSLVDSTQQILEAAMRGSWLRQTALTNNIANADTPGYQRQEVDFESTLQSAMAGGQPVDELQFTSQTVPTEAGPNGEAVSVDQESARLAENGLDYQALTDVVNTRNTIVRSAMGIL
jgi:flagellar basal-body rod protein FlgB